MFCRRDSWILLFGAFFACVSVPGTWAADECGGYVYVHSEIQCA